MKKLKDADKELQFTITKACATSASRYDKAGCVVAQALKALPGITSVEVGARTVRVFHGDEVSRYITPDMLRVALNTFDTTGEWMLPVGDYKLGVPTPGRSLQGHRQYEASRRQKDAQNKRDRAHNAGKAKAAGRPKAKNQFTHKQINPRVIEFAKIRKVRVTG